MDSTLRFCLKSFLEHYQVLNIGDAISRLKTKFGIDFTIERLLGIGGYNAVFEGADPTSVMRIYFQHNADTQLASTNISKETLDAHPTDAILSILDVISSRDYCSEHTWIVTRAQRVTPLLLVTSTEMAGKLFQTTVKTLDYLEEHDLFTLDIKLNNFGKVIGSSPSRYVYIDTDFVSAKPMRIFGNYWFAREDLIVGLYVAEHMKVLGLSTIGYAFLIALLRFGKIPGSDLYGGELDSEFRKNFLKVYKYLLGIHFYQQFFITKHEYEIRFGEGSSIEYMRLPEEEIDRISKLRDITKGDYSTPQNRVRKIIDKEIYSEEDLFITPTLTRVVQCTDFNPSQINSDFVLSLFEKSEGRIVYPDSPYPPCDDELYDLSLGLYHQSKRYSLYDGMTDDEDVSQSSASMKNSFEIPPPPTIPVPPPPTCSVSSVAASMPSSGAI